MPLPDLTIHVFARCTRCGTECEIDTAGWNCPACRSTWDHDGRQGSARRPTRNYGPPPSLLDRPTDSTSPTVLDQPQPDVEPL
jgi:hypothetical protein